MSGKIFGYFVTFLLFSLVCACQTIDIFKENSEISRTENHKSFVIINQEVNMQGFHSPALDQVVQTQIRKALESAGMSYNKKNPDLIIRYTSNEIEKTRVLVNNFNAFPMWGFRIWDPWSWNPHNPMNRNESQTNQYELLQIIIDFIDPKKDKFLMTLTGVTEITSSKSKPRIVLKTTDRILGKFLQDFNFESNKN